jgi:hypothetical protein
MSEVITKRHDEHVEAYKRNIRKNEELARLHTNAAGLLKRIHNSRGNPTLLDCAMAGIYANQLEKRRPANMQR